MKIDLNDITTNNEEKIELDLNSFFGVGEIKLDEIKTVNIDNLKKYLKKNLVIKKKPVIEINPNIVNVETIKINENLKKDIDLLGEEAEKDKFTLDYDDIIYGREIRKKHFDIFVKKTYNWKYFKKIFSGFGNNIDKVIMGFPKKYYIFTLSLLLFVSFLFGYKFVLENTISGTYKKMNNLISENGNLGKIDKEIKDISLKFSFSSLLFKPVFFANKLIKSEKIDNVGYLIEGGKNLANVLNDTVFLKGKILDFIEERDISNIYFTNLIKSIELKDFLKSINLELKDSLKQYYKIEPLDDVILNEKLLFAIKKLFYFNKQIELLIINYDDLLKLLGNEKQKKYLIVFQNNDEIRPTGGFMGSMGIVSIFRGKVEKFEKKDVYAYEWEINKKSFREPAPKGLHYITKTFGLRDANYFIDVARSSQKIKFFLKQAGEDIDGIIYINQNILLDFLDVLEGVQFDKIQRFIDSENFSEIMSSLVEAKKFKLGAQGSPKQILFDFIEAFTKKIKDKGEYEKYLGVIIRNLKTRDLMIYSFDENKILKSFGLDGTINFKETLDFNYPIFTSISGNKSDRYIKKTYKKRYEIGENCDILTKFQIDLEHTFNGENKKRVEKIFEEFEINKLPNYKNLLNIQGNGLNHSYVRVLIPRNAIIDTSVHNVKTYKNKNYKQVDFYLKTPVGGTSHRYMEYILKNPECKKYSYKVYKQPGIREYNLKFFNTKFDNIIYGDWEFRE